MSIFKQFIVSLGNFKEYPRLMQVKMGKAIGYLILISLLTGVFTSVYFAVSFNEITGGSENIISYIPEFEITDGLLTTAPVEEYLYDGELYIKVDTDVPMDKADIEQGENVILIDAEKMMTKTSYGEMQEYYFYELAPTDFDKEDLVTVGIPFMKKFVSVLAIIMVLAFVIGKLISLAFTAIVANIINSFTTKSSASFGDLYKLCIYANTLPVVVGWLLLVTPFSLPGWLKFAVTVGFVMAGLVAVNKKEEEEIKELRRAREAQDEKTELERSEFDL